MIIKCKNYGTIGWKVDDIINNKCPHCRALEETSNDGSILPIHDVNCSFYNFAKNYIRVKDGVNERSLNHVELKQVVEMQEMINNGYELRLISFRKGSRIMWVKKNCD